MDTSSTKSQVCNLHDSERDLELALRLYVGARSYMYMNYMAGFKLIVAWLQPLNLTDYHGDEKHSLPWYSRNYEIWELAKIIGCSEEMIVGTLERISKSNDTR